MFKRFWGKRPSHGTIVAYLALIAALATGSAYAADKIGSSDIARQAVKSKHVAKNAVKSKHVKDGQLAVADLADAAKGARAYAVVDPTSGSDPVLTSQSPRRGFDSVERVEEGVYCLTPSAGGVDPDRDPAAVNPEWFHSQPDDLSAFWVSPQVGCGAAEYEVRTFVGGVVADNVGFAVIVP